MLFLRAEARPVVLLLREREVLLPPVLFRDELALRAPDADELLLLFPEVPEELPPREEVLLRPFERELLLPLPVSLLEEEPLLCPFPFEREVLPVLPDSFLDNELRPSEDDRPRDSPLKEELRPSEEDLPLDSPLEEELRPSEEYLPRDSPLNDEPRSSEEYLSRESSLSLEELRPSEEYLPRDSPLEE